VEIKANVSSGTVEKVALWMEWTGSRWKSIGALGSWNELGLSAEFKMDVGIFTVIKNGIVGGKLVATVKVKYKVNINGDVGISVAFAGFNGLTIGRKDCLGVGAHLPVPVVECDAGLAESFGFAATKDRNIVKSTIWRI